MAQEAPITWVVLKSGQLLTGPSFVAHTVLSAGEAVIAAGEAIVTINGNERFCTEITTDSDHYQADAQSLEIGKQAFEAFGVRFAEEGRQRDSGYGEGTSGVGASDAAPQEEPRVFANTHPEDLAAELETAAILGISSMHVDDPDFRQLANDGPIKWVVTQGGDLLVASSIVAHTVLTNGEAVIAAGEAEVEINGHKRGLVINTTSDHYQADERSLEIGRQAFEAFGIEFSSAAGRDGSGNGHRGSAVAVQPEMSLHAPPSPQREGLDQQASTSGTSHLEVVQEPEAREVTGDGYGGQGDGNGGDGHGRVDANRLREAREAIKELLVMWANRNSAGDDVQVEYVRGESYEHNCLRVAMVMDMVMKIVVGRVVTMVVEIMEIMSCLMGRVAVMRAMKMKTNRAASLTVSSTTLMRLYCVALVRAIAMLISRYDAMRQNKRFLMR